MNSCYCAAEGGERTVDSSPEVAARVNHPLSYGLLTQLLLEQRVLVTEQLHGQLVVRRLK